MNDKEFTKKAFQDAINATLNSSKSKTSEEEFKDYHENVASNTDAIMDAARMKVEFADGIDIEQLAKVIVITGQQDAFVALTGTLMMICFHIGWKAGRGSEKSKEILTEARRRLGIVKDRLIGQSPEDLSQHYKLIGMKDAISGLIEFIGGSDK